MSLPKGVYSKDDCGKLKSKDSNHTIRSKQNTYHVVYKNIAPSKLSCQFNHTWRVEYSTQIYRFDTRGAKEYLKVLAAVLSIQPQWRLITCSKRSVAR